MKNKKAFVILSILLFFMFVPFLVNADADTDTDNSTDNDESKEIIPPDIDSEEITCESLLKDGNGDFNPLGQLLQDVFTFMKVIAPILLIVLSSLDYIKAIASKNADDLKKANERFIKRLIGAIILFLLPFLLDFLFNIFGVYDMQTCGIK